MVIRLIKINVRLNNKRLKGKQTEKKYSAKSYNLRIDFSDLVWFINDVQIDFRGDEQFSILNTDGPR